MLAELFATAAADKLGRVPVTFSTDAAALMMAYRWPGNVRELRNYLSQWTGMGGPNDITRGKDGNFYIAEQEDAGKPAYVCVRAGQGNGLARLESRHVHG